MKPSVRVCLTPALISQHDCRSSIVVVIDVLRATTTICTALGLGASGVIPVESEAECRTYRNANCRIAGERGGEKLPGFDLGNSPLELLKHDWHNIRLALTTTNGTRALHASMPCRHLVVGAFANRTVLAGWLAAQQLPVVLHCAGWRCEPNWEDTWLAGELVARLLPTHEPGDDTALLALSIAGLDAATLRERLAATSHYQRLLRLGHAADLDYCLQADTQAVVPRFDGLLLTDVLNQPAV